jgi:hypothetical protein
VVPVMLVMLLQFCLRCTHAVSLGSEVSAVLSRLVTSWRGWRSCCSRSGVTPSRIASTGHAGNSRYIPVGCRTTGAAQVRRGEIPCQSTRLCSF